MRSRAWFARSEKFIDSFVRFAYNNNCVERKENSNMIQVTATDFKTNLGKYFSLVGREDIHITKNGMDVAILTAPKPMRSWVDDISGIIPNVDIDEKQIKAERLTKKYESLD